MPHLMDLPDEILLHIQSFLPLTSLVAARGVCQLWRSVLPGSHIPTYRRDLLQLYLRALDSPAFVATRKLVDSRLKPFNRAHFLDSLPKDVPAEFACWVHEWPARAAIGAIWPGIHLFCDSHSGAELIKDRGRSLLSMATPIWNHLLFDAPSPGYVRAAPGWGTTGSTGTALLLDDARIEGWQCSRLLVLSGRWDGADLAGKVYQIDGVQGRLDTPVAGSWVEYLTQELEREEAWLRAPPRQVPA